MKTKFFDKNVIAGGALIVILLLAYGVFGKFLYKITSPSLNVPAPFLKKISDAGEHGVKRFASQEEFKEYLSKSSELDSSYGFASRTLFSSGMEVAPQAAMDSKDMQYPTATSLSGGARDFSETNAQVTGKDEPDIVKTDGKNIYVSQENGYKYMMPMVTEPQVMPFAPAPFEKSGKRLPLSYPSPDVYVTPKTKIIQTPFEKDIQTIGSVAETGNLLVRNGLLFVLSADGIYSYDVRNAENPKKKWSMKLAQNVVIEEARMSGDELYVVTRTGVRRDAPCPIALFQDTLHGSVVPCDSVYHPSEIVVADSVYTVSNIDSETGEMKKTVSFIAGSNNAVVYVSENNVYMGYAVPSDRAGGMFEMFTENASMLPDWARDRVRKVRGYDLSRSAKMAELDAILQDVRIGMSSDDALKFNQELNNASSQYFEKHKREMERTDIVKIAGNSFQIESVGSVPGRLLNQFSLDEYEGYVRVATTIGDTWRQFGNREQSESDVYVLDNRLHTVGSVQGLGKDERIYSVRFIGDKGYVVTFRETDPLYVIDFSSSQNPRLAGELKVPGYSAYLHPIGEKLLLGIGKDGQSVKASLFDVSSNSNPKEIATYILDDYWSQILTTHHAFLEDERHEIFFLPGSRGGYVFSYAGGSLDLVKAIDIPNMKRAVYIGDFLYIVGEKDIVVLNENTWEESGRISF